MDRGQPDRDSADFARFRDGGDVDALARVFDHTAPRLALVAAHLVGDGAEDLVQTVFLEALRNAAAFDATRPLMPWLLAILARRAADLLRGKMRRARHVGDVDPTALADRDAGPDAIAVERDAVAHIAAAIDSLDGPSREVLALRLLNELSPVEIARALDRPLGTVHAQLHRGLARLRSKLSRSAFAALALVTGQARLERVRDHVLAQARPLGTPLAAVAAGAAVKKMLALVTALVLCLLAPMSLWMVTAKQGASASVERATRVATVSAIAKPPDEDAPTNARSLATVTATTDPRDVHIRGRLVRAEDSTPIARAPVTLSRYPTMGRRDLPAGTERETTVATDDAGHFAFDATTDRRIGFEVIVRVPDRPECARTWDQLAPGKTVVLGDLRIPRGALTRFRVVDDHERPVAGFSVQLDCQDRLPSGLSLVAFNGTKQTDADGRLPSLRLPIGRYGITSDETLGYAGWEPGEFNIDDAVAERDLVLRMHEKDPAHSIGGVVVDVRGDPVAGVVVFVGSPGVQGFRRERTRSDGSFRIAWSGSASIEVHGVGTGWFESSSEYELLEPSTPVTLGTLDLRVVLRARPHSLVRLAVHAADGRPVEEYRTALIPVLLHCKEAPSLTTILLEREDGATGLSLPPITSHRGGLTDFADLRPGDHLLFVQAVDPSLEPVFARQVQVVEGQDQYLEVSLRQRPLLHVHVVDGRARPVEGCHVELVRSTARELSWDRSVFTESQVFDDGMWGSVVSVAVATGTTDAAGGVTLTGAPLEGCASLHVEGPNLIAKRQMLTTPVAADSDITVTVDRAGAIRGRITPVEAVRAIGPTAAQRAPASLGFDPENELETDRAEVELHGRRTSRSVECRIDDDGIFTADGLPPDDYSVELRMPGGHGPHTCPEITALAAGERRQLTIDLADSMPASLEADVFLDGVAVDGGTLELVGQSGNASTRVEHGRAQFTRTWPGTFVAKLEDPTLGTRTLRANFVTVTPIVILPGSTQTARFEFAQHALALTLVDDTEHPLASWTISIEVDTACGRIWVTALDTDARGTAHIVSAPTGVLHVLGRPAAADAESTELANFTFSGDPAEQRLRIHIPASFAPPPTERR